MIAPKVVLIGGAPMTGKSTIARLLAGELGRSCLSTDDIGQAIEAVTTPESHPAMHRMTGQDFRDYYAGRSVEQLIADAHEHHAALWPAVARIATAHASWGSPIVIEGWALLPQEVARVQVPGVQSVWLVAQEPLLECRLRQDHFWRGAADEQAMLRHFLARSLWFNGYIRETAGRLGLPVVEIRADEPPREVADRCLRVIGMASGMKG